MKPFHTPFNRGDWVKCPSGLVAMVHGFADDKRTIVLLSTDPGSGTWQQIAPEACLQPLVNPNAGAAQAYPAGRWTGGAK